MAYSVVWPLSLPQSPQDSFSESGGGINVIRTAPDQGPAKQRRRGLTTREMSVSFLMTDAQVSALDVFIHDTIYGVARFGFPHPRTHVVEEVRIVPQQGGEIYSCAYVTNDRWNVSMKLEILP